MSQTNQPGSAVAPAGLPLQVPTLADLDAYELIEAVTVRGDELHPTAVRMLAVWALAKAERADWLQDEIDALKKAGVQ